MGVAGELGHNYKGIGAGELWGWQESYSFHTPNQCTIAREFFRVLRRGGKLVGLDWMSATGLSEAEYGHWIGPINLAWEATTGSPHGSPLYRPSPTALCRPSIALHRPLPTALYQPLPTASLTAVVCSAGTDVAGTHDAYLGLWPPSYR